MFFKNKIKVFRNMIYNKLYKKRKCLKIIFKYYLINKLNKPVNEFLFINIIIFKFIIYKLDFK